MEEIWKNVVGYEGLYEVSNLGRVKRVARKIIRSDGMEMNIKESILKSHKDDYEKVFLTKGDLKECLLVHRAVADSFLNNPLRYIKHLDGDNFNNCVYNLEWSSKKESYRSKLNDKKIKYIKENEENLSVYELAEMFNVCNRTIKMYMNETT